MRWLARREYARAELARRLRARGFRQDVVEQTLDSLQENGLQSDRRYCEALVHSRRRGGYGPLRIAAELAQQGVARELVGDMLDPNDPSWRDQARALLAKRRTGPSSSPAERAKLQRFLHYRGYTAEQSAAAMESD